MLRVYINSDLIFSALLMIVSINLIMEIAVGINKTINVLFQRGRRGACTFVTHDNAKYINFAHGPMYKITRRRNINRQHNIN